MKGSYEFRFIVHKSGEKYSSDVDTLEVRNQ